jgi:hypothetical protein
LRTDDLFDPLSGAVKLRDWEFAELPQDHPSVAFFRKVLPHGRSSTKAPHLAWSMYSDTGFLLRGPNYYYGLSRQGREVTFSEYFPHVVYLLDAAKEAVAALQGTEASLPLFKVLLGFADNMRNALITLQYACLLAESEQTKAEFVCTRKVYTELLVPHTKQHYHLLLNADLTWRAAVAKYLECLMGISDRLRTLESELQATGASLPATAEVVRRWRESDQFLQNLTAVQLGLHEFEQRGHLTGRSIACGIAYGGTELPAIAQAVGEARGLRIGAAFAKLSLYGQREQGEKVRLGDTAYVEDFLLTQNRLCVLDDTPLSDATTFLLDDNFTTGATLQLARDLVVVCGGDVGGAIVVGFPGSNRIAQMAMDGHGFVDPDLLFGFVRGLTAPSPYSRLFFAGSTDATRYLDQVGVFNKARRRIEGYLRKNEAEEMVE